MIIPKIGWREIRHSSQMKKVRKKGQKERMERYEDGEMMKDKDRMKKDRKKKKSGRKGDIDGNI